MLPGWAFSFVAAIQASLSVLLVISYGAISAHFSLLSVSTARGISKACVRMFLPALILTSIGAELAPSSAKDYLFVLYWALFCHLVSFVLGIIAHLALKMPDWTTPALMFNNTTSYPLLLVAALEQTGILHKLHGGDNSGEHHDHDEARAVARMKSYFLVFSTVSSCLTFAVGPRLIDSEHAPEEMNKDATEESDETTAVTEATEQTSETAEETLETTGLLSHASSSRWAEDRFFPSRRASSIRSASTSTHRRASIVPPSKWDRLGPRMQWWILFICDFFNAPLLGALAGTLIGLTPALKTAFFGHLSNGGIFTAWLTASMKSIGSLFVPLPVVITGVSLYAAMSNTRRVTSDEELQGSSSKLPLSVVMYILTIRFVVWPIVSIGLIYLLVTQTHLLGDNPMLWFALMLMPTGPPAMKLITLIQVSNAGQEDETAMAKLLTVGLNNCVFDKWRH
ncbi:hypothetical protein Cpir12675_003941 [Ceratocystis pirilliformis]|uniref:Transporter C5D6.04 n=1 Tax=Ceratocystis pirilliformis TaxID=259994 RepID=A0ABR3Z0J2_9PEZI